METQLGDCFCIWPPISITVQIEGSYHVQRGSLFTNPPFAKDFQIPGGCQSPTYVDRLARASDYETRVQVDGVNYAAKTAS